MAIVNDWLWNFANAVGYDIVFDKLHGESEKCTCQGHGIFMDKCLWECPVRQTHSRPKDSIEVPCRKVGAEDGRKLHVRLWWCSNGLESRGFVLAPLYIPIWVIRDLRNLAIHWLENVILGISVRIVMLISCWLAHSSVRKVHINTCPLFCGHFLWSCWLFTLQLQLIISAVVKAPPIRTLRLSHLQTYVTRNKGFVTFLFQWVMVLEDGVDIRQATIRSVFYVV
jgi:hypothetical protein